MAAETDITRWQHKQNMSNNFSATIPYEMEQMRKETKEFLDDLTTRDQRMMFVLVTLVHVADTMEQLEADTETLLSIGRKNLCQFASLKYQQEDGLNTALPYGLRRIDALRTLTTESTAVLMPFSTQEVMDKGGIYYGINAISRNLIVCNRKMLLNGNGLYRKGTGNTRKTQAVAPLAAQMDGHPQKKSEGRNISYPHLPYSIAEKNEKDFEKSSVLPPVFLLLVGGCNPIPPASDCALKTRERRLTSIFYTPSIHNSMPKGANTMQTTFNGEDKPHTATGAVDFKKRIGSTTYVVSVHFSKASTETIEDKILRLLEREGKKTA